MKKLILYLLAMSLLFTVQAMATSVQLMDKDELKGMLDSPDLIVLDVRTGKDWSSSEFKIKGAQRIPEEALVNWAHEHARGKTVVLYCA